MRLLFCLLLLLMPVTILAQAPVAPDSANAPQPQPAELIEEVQQQQDSLLNLPTAVVDSIQLQGRLDSLRQLSHAFDTLKLKKSIDSLQQLPLPSEVLQPKVDSVQNLLDVQQKAKVKVQELEGKLNEPLVQERQHLQDKLNKASSLEEVNQEGLSDLKEQTGLQPDTQLPQVEGVNLQGIEVGEGSGIDIPEMDLPTDELPSLDLPSTESFEELSGRLGKVGEIGEKAGAYTEDISQISKGKLPEVESVDQLAEEQLLSSESGKALQEQIGASQAGMGEMNKFSSKDYFIEQGKEQAFEAAVDHFAGHGEELNAAKAKLTKYKGRFEEVKSVKEMPKGFFKLNPLKDDPWQERLLIGSLWQFGKGEEQLRIDLGPTLAWRFTDRLSAGIGYHYRLSVQLKEWPWFSAADKVQGYQLFSDFRFKKGFFARLLFEDLHTAVPRLNAAKKIETTDPQWVKGLSAGIGKSYTFYKSVQGYGLVQYNILHRHNKTPYAKALQAKIGFYINGKHIFRKRDKE